jgi:hypothetical protein
MANSIRSIIKQRMILIPVLVILLGVAVYFASFLPTADWYATFDPAARGVFSGHSPYEQVTYIYPPWGVLPLFPIVLFPPMLAHGLMFVTSTLILIYITWRLGASPLTAAAFFLSPTVIGALLVSNIDPMVISGIFLPPVWGLFILMIKPQIGIGVAFYYLLDTWKKWRFWGAVRVFAPIAIAYLVAALLFPVWIERMIRNPQIVWNRSLFPYTIPVGLFFMWLSVRRKNPYFALAAGLFFAPYYSFYSYITVQIAFLHKDVEKYIRRDVLQIILTVFLWVVMLAFRL